MPREWHASARVLRHQTLANVTPIRPRWRRTVALLAGVGVVTITVLVALGVRWVAAQAGLIVGGR